MEITIRLANYQDITDGKHIIAALNHYATDPMGGGEALSDYAKQHLIAGLASTPNAFTLLAFVDDQLAGLTNCFQTFSTFKCKPVINIHDLAVMTPFRGLGISTKMIEKVAEIARERKACKLTLEVLEGNKIAQQAYLKVGFSSYELDAAMGKAMFWEKPL